VIQILLWAPLAAGLLACATPQRLTGWVATLGALVTLVLGIIVVAGFDPSGGLQHSVDESWIPTLGVRYQLGVDGISLFLVLLTAVLWFAATLWSAFNPPERPRTYFLMFGLAESAVLGAFLAQDLILFVLFFDLMLIPFYFLFGSWGTDHPGRPEEDEGPIRRSRR
jgi:NADH-quinone oxidoreductase subunit M